MNLRDALNNIVTESDDSENTNYENKNFNIVELCDIWLNSFYTTYSLFNEYVMSKRKKMHNKLYSQFEIFFTKNKKEQDSDSINLVEDEYVMSYDIKLNLFYENKIIVDGINLTIEQKNYSIFKYLILNLFVFYIKNNYKDEINIYDIAWERKLNNDHERKLRKFLDLFFFEWIDIDSQSVGKYSSYFYYRDIYTNDKSLDEILDTIMLRANNGIYNIDDLLIPIKEELLTCDKSNLEIENILEYQKEKEKTLKKVIFGLNKKKT